MKLARLFIAIALILVASLGLSALQLRGLGGPRLSITGEKDEMFDVYAARTRDKKMILLTSRAKTSAEVRYLRADQPSSPLQIVLPRAANHDPRPHPCRPVPSAARTQSCRGFLANSMIP